MADYWQNEYQVARLTVLAKVEYLPAALSFMNEVFIKLGLIDEDVKRIRLVVEEACINVIDHAFDPGEQSSFDLVISRRPL